MKKEIFVRTLLKLCVCFTAISLSLLLNGSHVYSDSDSKDNEMNIFKEHVEKLRDNYPELNDKLMQVEEKLRTGIPLKECCIVCHVKNTQE